MTIPQPPEHNPFAPPAYSSPAKFDVFARPHAAPPEASRIEAASGLQNAQVEATPVPVSAVKGPMNRSATLGLVLACSSVALTPVVGLAGMVVARQALAQIATTGERGASRAKAAIRIGIALAVVWTAAVAFVIAMNIGATAA